MTHALRAGWLIGLTVVLGASASAQQIDLTPRTWQPDEARRFDSLTRTWGRRVPLALGEAGIITATSTASAVRGGLEALKRGGTAIDAALTHALANIVLWAGCCVSHAGFMTLTYYEATTGKVHSMNAAWNTVREETDPRSIPSNAPSGRSALVPGFMAGAEAAHQRFGKLPWATLFGPAIYYAEEGFVLDPAVGGMIKSKAKVLERLPATKAVFTRSDGEWYQAGDLFKQPALARTLRRVAEQGASYMYRGEWAKKLVAAVQADGGKMTMQDLEDYHVIWGEPAHTRFRDYDVYAIGLPNLGGMNMVEALNLVELADLGRLGHPTASADALYQLIRISRVGDVLGTAITSMAGVPVSLLQRYAPDLDPTVEARLTKVHAQRVWAAMQTPSWADLDREAFGWALRPGSDHSDAVIAVDRWGNVAALLHTINTSVWGNTGIMIDGVSIADPARFQQLPIARAGPGNRLPDPTNPLIVLKDGKPVLASSSIGTGLHEQTLQSLVNVLEYGMDPKSAVDTAQFVRPVFVATATAKVGDQVVAEGEFSQALLDAVRNRGIGIAVVPPGQARGVSGGWVGVTLDPKTGRRWAAAPRHWNGWALGY